MVDLIVRIILVFLENLLKDRNAADRFAIKLAESLENNLLRDGNFDK